VVCLPRLSLPFPRPFSSPRPPLFFDIEKLSEFRAALLSFLSRNDPFRLRCAGYAVPLPQGHGDKSPPPLHPRTRVLVSGLGPVPGGLQDIGIRAVYGPLLAFGWTFFSPFRSCCIRLGWTVVRTIYNGLVADPFLRCPVWKTSAPRLPSAPPF